MPKKLIVVVCLAAAITLSNGVAQADPEPRSAYAKCIKANGGHYNPKYGRWYAGSAQGGVAARNCLERRSKAARNAHPASARMSEYYQLTH